MPNEIGPEWVRLGGMLVRRRIEMDSRYRNRQQFCRERGADYRTVAAIENAERDNFEAGTLSAAEVWYSLASGSIARALKGAEFQPARTGAGPAPLPAPAPQPDPDELGAWERAVWSEVSDSLARHGPGATGAQVFPASAVEASVWDTRRLPDREAKVRLIAKLRAISDESAAESRAG